MTINKQEISMLCITDVSSLDEIRVFFDDKEKGRGHITITCWGKSWSAYFGAIGKENTMLDFVRSSSVDYLAKALARPNEIVDVIDFDTLSSEIGECITEPWEIGLFFTKINDTYPCKDMPYRENNEYHYLKRIVAATKQAIEEEM